MEKGSEGQAASAQFSSLTSHSFFVPWRLLCQSISVQAHKPFPASLGLGWYLLALTFTPKSLYQWPCILPCPSPVSVHFNRFSLMGLKSLLPGPCFSLPTQSP